MRYKKPIWQRAAVAVTIINMEVAAAAAAAAAVCWPKMAMSFTGHKIRRSFVRSSAGQTQRVAGRERETAELTRRKLREPAAPVWPAGRRSQSRHPSTTDVCRLYAGPTARTVNLVLSDTGC